MSKKSKHHKPKGPRNPPQNTVPKDEDTPPLDVEPRVPNPKPDPPSPVEVKLVPELSTVIETPATSESVPSVADVQTPVKPKRHRGNRKKKHAENLSAADPTDGVNVESKQIPANEIKKNDEKLKVVEQPVKPNIIESSTKVLEGKKDESVKDKGSEPCKKGENKNKKGGGGSKTEDDKTKAKQPEKQDSELAKKQKGNQQQVKENISKQQNEGKKKTENVEEVKKDSQSAKKVEIKVEEKLIVEEKNKKDNADAIDSAFVEIKTGKKSKSKNKKGKEVIEETSQAQIDILPAIVSESIAKDCVTPSKIEEEKNKVEITTEQPKPEVQTPVKTNEPKNKKDKNANKKKQNENESADKNNNKDKTKKDLVALEKSSTNTESIIEPQKETAQDTLDDILPSLASSIEETLKKLIVCESDELFGQQLQAEDEKKRKAEKALSEENKELLEPKKETLIAEDKISCNIENKPKEITTVCEIIKPPDLLAKIFESEDKNKHVDVVPEPIALPFIPIRPITPESLPNITKPIEEVPKNKDNNKKGDKIDEKKVKQDTKCSFIDICKLPSSEKKEMPKLSDIMPSFSGIVTEPNVNTPESDKIQKPLDSNISKITGSENVPLPSPKLEKKIYEPPVMSSSIPDEIIEALLSDIPPEFISEPSKTISENPLCNIPIAKSETVKDNLPECASKMISEISVKPQDTVVGTSLSKENIFEILDTKTTLDNIEACPLKTAISDVECQKSKISTPEIEEKKDLPIEKSEEHKQSPKQKSKKHDKKKNDQADLKTPENIKTPPVIKELSEIVPAVIESKVEDISKTSSDSKEKCEDAPMIKPEAKPVDVPSNVDSSKPTDSPKPTKRQKDKKNKQGGNKNVDSPTSQKQTSSAEETAGTQAQQTAVQDSNTDKPGNSEKTKPEQKSSQEKSSKGKSKTHSNTQTENTESIGATQKQSQETDNKSIHLKDISQIVKDTNEDFELLKVTDSIAEGSTSKEDGKDPNRSESKPRQRSPFKDQPKNLLGPSNIPAKSNKFDYKKEKNKDPEQANAETAKTKMKDISSQHLPVVDKKSGQSPKMQKRTENTQNTINNEQKPITFGSKLIPSSVDKSAKHKEQIVDINNNIIEIDDEEEFVYKYSFRTVFIANACHICKMQLKDDRVVCRFCHLVGYCCEKHRDDDWMQHQSLCYSICTLSHVKGTDHIYGDAKSLNGQDYRMLRMQAIVSCEKLLKRKLYPWEQEVLLYPRICCEVNCRECKTSELKDCDSCGQVSYCANKPEHLPPNHATWCQSYKLYHRLVLHQLTSGRIEPPLPSKILPAGYILPDKCSTLLDDLYGCVLNMDECHYATLTQLSTAPLSALYGYQKAIGALKLIEQAAPTASSGGGSIETKKEKLVLHIVGAELQFEADSLNKWEVFFLHLINELKELRIVFIGPELNTANLPVDLLTRIKVCQSCRQMDKTVKFEFHDGQLYHDFVESEKFTKPDLICAFNAGLHRATGYAGLDTWPETIASALRLRVPICATAYTEHEAPRDLARILRAGVSTNVIVTPTPNPYASLRPDRNFISDDEMPLIFKNFHYSLVVGC